MTRNIQFRNVERKVYSRSFLNTVFVIFDYEVDREPADILPRVKQFISENFNLQIELSDAEFQHGFSIDCKDHDHSYYIRRGSIGVKYMGLNYVSFSETMMPLVYRLLVFIKNTLAIQQLSGMQIRKVNVWDMKDSEESPVDKVQMVRDYLSDNLAAASQPGQEYMGLTDVREISGEYNGAPYMIRYGFRKGVSSNNEKYVGLVLDESIEGKGILVENIESELSNLNNSIFDMFHWCVSQNTLSLMNKEQ